MKEAVLKDAMRLRRDGRLAEAAELYRSILREHPNDFEALHALGIVRYQCGAIEEAEGLIEQAIGIRPDAADAWYNRACLLQKLGRLSEALSCFDRAILCRPGYIEALINRGTTLLMLQRPREALDDFECVTSARPEVFEAWSSRGRALMGLNRAADALASFEKALTLKPGVPLLWKDRAAVLVALGRADEALASLKQALRLNPGDPEALLRQADMLFMMTRFGEAASSYETYLARYPQDAEAWNRRGVALVELKRREDALVCFDRAIKLDPANPDVWTNRGNLLSEMKRFLEAAKDYEKALALDPAIPYALGYLVSSRIRSCDWSRLGEDRELVAAGVRAGRPIIDPMNHLAISYSPAEQLASARIFLSGEREPPALWRGEIYGHDRIRLAYLSADYRPHAVAFLIAGVFEHHDRSRFETIGISFGPGAGSDIRTRIENGCDRFFDVREKGDLDIATMLRQMEVDVAVDLMGFTDGCRPGILACRPCPVQVNFLGYPGTMGAKHIDYIVADRTLIPEDERPFYSEAIAYLPDTYQANDSLRLVAERTPSRKEAGLPDKGFVFCCFNNNYKIMPEVFDIWMRLLANVEDSVLWLLKDHETAADNLRREAVRRGVSANRLVFAPRVAPADHLARQRLADLFLDTQPYGAHTTASDALWVGLPVLTCCGRTFAGRVAASLNRAIGLPELVTRDLREYEALALSLAHDEKALASLKAKLLQHRQTSALFDTARFTRHLESAFAAMAARQQAGESPKSFSVPPEARMP